MKEYPSIDRKIRYGEPVYLFDKLDGSNIRAEWSRKKGRFYKYGSRTQLIDSGHPFLGESVFLIQDNFEEELARIFEKQRWHKTLAFFEFYGPQSFAGFHEKEDQHKVTLIDVKPFKHGILNPDEYLDLFGHLDTAKLLYRGNMNKEVEEQIRKQELPGITFEGAVGKIKVKGKTQNPAMFKVKTYAWLERLKNYCKGDDNLYKRLL